MSFRAIFVYLRDLATLHAMPGLTLELLSGLIWRRALILFPHPHRVAGIDRGGRPQDVRTGHGGGVDLPLLGLGIRQGAGGGREDQEGGGDAGEGDDEVAGGGAVVFVEPGHCLVCSCATSDRCSCCFLLTIPNPQRSKRCGITNRLLS